MSQEDKTTQEEAVNSTAETTEKAEPEVAPEAEPEKSMEEVIEEVEPKAKEPETIGLDKYLSIKKEKKELERQLKELNERKEEDDEDVSDDIDALADQYNIDKKFLKNFAKSIEKNAQSRIDEKLAPLTAKEKQAKVDEAFGKAYEGVLERMPEYKNVANSEVIKALALNPANSKKTLSQILEEAYGNAITGKRTIETTKPGGGKEPKDIDFDRAKTDAEYFKEIMANPDLKQKYNESNFSRLQNYL